MTNPLSIKVFVLVDEDGNYDCGPDAETAAKRFGEDVEVSGGANYRLLELRVSLPVPAPIVMAGEVTGPEKTGVLRVVESPAPIREVHQGG